SWCGARARPSGEGAQLDSQKAARRTSGYPQHLCDRRSPGSAWDTEDFVQPAGAVRDELTRMRARAERRAVVALLAAEVISTTGGEITAVALPWFVLVTTGSPARMGAVLAAGFLGMAVLGIPSGRAATALGPRRTMLVADAACAPTVALIPALHWAGLLSFPVIVAAA